MVEVLICLCSIDMLFAVAHILQTPETVGLEALQPVDGLFSSFEG